MRVAWGQMGKPLESWGRKKKLADGNQFQKGRKIPTLAVVMEKKKDLSTMVMVLLGVVGRRDPRKTPEKLKARSQMRAGRSISSTLTTVYLQHSFHGKKKSKRVVVKRQQENSGNRM